MDCHVSLEKGRPQLQLDSYHSETSMYRRKVTCQTKDNGRRYLDFVLFVFSTDTRSLFGVLDGAQGSRVRREISNWRRQRGLQINP